MRYKLLGLIVTLSICGAALFTSCAEKIGVDYNQIEQQVFEAWMAKNRPDLVENKQPQGYYVEIIDEGDYLSPPVNDTICWVKYDFTGEDLSGNICLTRNDITAWQQNSFQQRHTIFLTTVIAVI